LLRYCSQREVRDYVDILERAVANSRLDLAPGRVWFGPHIDTLLVFLDDKLVAGLCVRTVGMLDPLVIVDDLGPLPARLLDHVRLRAEGVLTAQGHEEYYLGVPAEAPKGWSELIVKMGGSEDLAAQGTRMFRRVL